MISQSRHGSCGRFILGALAAAIALGASAARAVPINYGDFGPDPPGVSMYLGVTESSATDPIPPGRFGPPELNLNTLDFDPNEFAAMATGGSLDITDVQLNFRLMTVAGAGLSSIVFSESGDYTLFGGGTALTQIAAGLAIQIDILAVDGVALATPLKTFHSTSFTADLVSDGPVQVAPWGNSLTIDLDAVLTEHNIAHNLGVTKAKVVIDDQLIAISEPTSVAFIAKKDFRIGPTVVIVPEPGSVVLMAGAIVGYGFTMRRRLGRSVRRLLG